MEESPLYWPLLYLAVNFEVENIFSSFQVSNSVYQMQRNKYLNKPEIFIL